MRTPLARLLPQNLLRALFLVVLAVAAPVFAGPPLICHPYAIGEAASLPSGKEWHGISTSYDRTHLIADTLGLLQPTTPLIVRMETLRRAALYVTNGMKDWGSYSDTDRALGYGLLEKLRERTQTTDRAARALALFDVGFYAETLRQTRMDPKLDGYALLLQAAELRPNDPEVDFALALASVSLQKKEHADHLARVRAGAKPGTLLAANVSSHFKR